MQPKLSILIPTIVGREDLLQTLTNSMGFTLGLDFYVSGVDTTKQVLLEDDNVEVLCCRDNKEMKVGEKRNKLIELAKGGYVSFIDDDDRVSDDYTKELLAGIETGADVITFNVGVSLNGSEPKPCYYSMYFENDYNERNAYYRLPNHLMCVKRELATQVPFIHTNFGEDADYAKRLKPLLKSEHSISKTLYYYDFNSEKTETQRR